MIIEKPKKRKVVMEIEIDDIEAIYGDKHLSLRFWNDWIGDKLPTGTNYNITRLVIRESLK